MDEIETPKSGVDRRSLLKKGAVAGAVAWTAPAVISSPAFASTGTFGCSAPVISSIEGLGGPGSFEVRVSTATLKACLSCTGTLNVAGVSNVESAVVGSSNTAVFTVAGNPTTFTVRFTCGTACMILAYSRSGSTWTQLGSEAC